MNLERRELEKEQAYADCRVGGDDEVHAVPESRFRCDCGFESKFGYCPACKKAIYNRIQ